MNAIVFESKCKICCRYMHTWAHTHQKRLEGHFAYHFRKEKYITYTHNCLSKMAFGPLLSFLLQGIVFSLLTRSGKKIWPQSLPLTLLICNTSAVGLRCVSYSYIRFLRVLWLFHFSLSRNPSMTWPWLLRDFSQELIMMQRISRLVLRGAQLIGYVYHFGNPC